RRPHAALPGIRQDAAGIFRAPVQLSPCLHQCPQHRAAILCDFAGGDDGQESLASAHMDRGTGHCSFLFSRLCLGVGGKENVGSVPCTSQRTPFMKTLIRLAFLFFFAALAWLALYRSDLLVPVSAFVLMLSLGIVGS